MNHVRYDFPGRVRTPGSTQREIHRLSRSLSAAVDRKDRRVAQYLGQRIQRAQMAMRRFGDLDDLPVL